METIEDMAEEGTSEGGLCRGGDDKWDLDKFPNPWLKLIPGGECPIEVADEVVGVGMGLQGDEDDLTWELWMGEEEVPFELLLFCFGLPASIVSVLRVEDGAPLDRHIALYNEY